MRLIKYHKGVNTMPWRVGEEDSKRQVSNCRVDKCSSIQVLQELVSAAMEVASSSVLRPNREWYQCLLLCVALISHHVIHFQEVPLHTIAPTCQLTSRPPMVQLALGGYRECLQGGLLTSVGIHAGTEVHLCGANFRIRITNSDPAKYLSTCLTLSTSVLLLMTTAIIAFQRTTHVV